MKRPRPGSIVKLRMRFLKWFVEQWVGGRKFSEDGPMSWAEAEKLYDRYVAAGWSAEQ